MPRSALVAAGVSESRLRAAVRSGEIWRIRRGWYAARDADRHAVEAVTAGGRLTCTSALERYGVWCFHDSRTHVSIAPAGRRFGSGVVFHSGHMRSPRTPDFAVDSPGEALERLARCMSPIGFLVAADSAVNLGLVSMSQLGSTIGATTRGARLVAAVDGSCESGVETIVRVALRARRVRRTPQVKISGVGRVDLVVGDRLVVECDGFEWHKSREAFEEDRRRDLALAARGYLVVRLTFDRVLTDWDQVQRDLVTLIRRGDHLWNARHRPLGHDPRAHAATASSETRTQPVTARERAN
jgi:very-short-patch-repair endonuclease